MAMISVLLAQPIPIHLPIALDHCVDIASMSSPQVAQQEQPTAPPPHTPYKLMDIIRSVSLI